MTPAEKRHDSAVVTFAKGVVSQLRLAPEAHSDPGVVVRIFANTKASKFVKADAYVLLDERYRLFGSDMGWHSALRGCRNHPIHGVELFSLFQ